MRLSLVLRTWIPWWFVALAPLAAQTPAPVTYSNVVGAALRAGDPKAEVVTAGLPQSKLGVPFETYLKRMYAAGAYGTFDVLAINAASASTQKPSP